MVADTFKVLCNQLNSQRMKIVLIFSLIYRILFLPAFVDNSKNDGATEIPSNVALVDPTTIDTIRRDSNTTFKLSTTAIFAPQNKKIVLMQDSLDRKLLLFQTKLQVNTDGTPLSYHPQDLKGKTKAINTIGNAVAIYKDGVEGNIFIKRGFFGEAISVYEKFRDSAYRITPPGYRIRWNNVLIPENLDGVDKPCIFKSGPYKGYYGSATALKNGLSSNKGDCNCNDQVNPLEIPALVLVGGKKNPLWKNGARLGDLLIAYNPKNNAVAYAIINDIGPRNKLGEGSVLLNMQLNKKNQLPKNRKDTYKLITKNEVIIAIISGSRKYKIERPYTAQNIENRITFWLHENGFNHEAAFVDFLKRNIDALE